MSSQRRSVDLNRGYRHRALRKAQGGRMVFFRIIIYMYTHIYLCVYWIYIYIDCPALQIVRTSETSGRNEPSPAETVCAVRDCLRCCFACGAAVNRPIRSALFCLSNLFLMLHYFTVSAFVSSSIPSRPWKALCMMHAHCVAVVRLRESTRSILICTAYHAKRGR